MEFRMDDKEEQLKNRVAFYKVYLNKFVKIVYRDNNQNIVIRGQVLQVNDLHIQIQDRFEKLPVLILLEEIVSVREDKDRPIHEFSGGGKDGTY
jgi:hypothetical protein